MFICSILFSFAFILVYYILLSPTGYNCTLSCTEVNLGKQAITTYFKQSVPATFQIQYVKVLVHSFIPLQAAACLHMDTVLYYQIRKKIPKLVYFTSYRTQFYVATGENYTTQHTQRSRY